MGDSSGVNACGTIQSCSTLNWQDLVCEDPGTYRLSLPGQDLDTAVAFLEELGGPTAGAGRAMKRIGVDAPLLRKTYKLEIEGMIAQITRRLDRGESKESVARWVSSERVRIAQRARASSGVVGRAIYEIRDRRQYGPGGRTWANVERRYAARGLSGEAMYENIIKGAQKSNASVNSAALRGAAFLKHGGRVVLLVGVGVSVARVLSAREHELARVIGEEAAGFAGGSVGAGALIGACMIFGVATGGWGLLACGAIGGAAGGMFAEAAASHLLEGVYYGKGLKDIPEPGQVAVQVSPDRLHNVMPREMSSCN